MLSYMKYLYKSLQQRQIGREFSSIDDFNYVSTYESLLEQQQLQRREQQITIKLTTTET